VTRRPLGRSGHVTRLATTLLALSGVALLVGCDERGLTAATTTRPSHGPLVVYERAGGIAFTAQRMVIDEDGSATVEVEGPGKIGAQFDLSGAEIDELRGLLDGATLESPPEPSACADCYAYSLEHDGRTASFDQTSFPPGTEPLVAFLSKLVERETPAGPAREG
jgi:hypothetical protein